MPASGKKEVMSEAELEQRMKAGQSGTTHGVYAFRDRGESALDHSGRSRLEELKESVQEREGVLQLMQERAANAVMMVEVITSHVAREVKLGVPLSDIAILRALPAFMNTAQRALKDLIAVMPNDPDVLDAVNVLKAVKDEQTDE